MAKAAAAGHRVVLVVATRGEQGEVAEGYLAAGGGAVAAPGGGDPRRRRAARRASRVEFLGYVDSGMMGLPTNDDPECFWQADVEEAAGRLAAILDEEQADVLTAYDENGVYGHPDHIQVHRVGVRAGELAGTPKVYLSTVDKDRVKTVARRVPWRAAVELPGDLDRRVRARCQRGPDHHDRSTSPSFVDLKRRAMAAHASQISRGVVLPRHAPGRCSWWRSARRSTSCCDGRPRHDRDRRLRRPAFPTRSTLLGRPRVVGVGDDRRQRHGRAVGPGRPPLAAAAVEGAVVVHRLRRGGGVRAGLPGRGTGGRPGRRGLAVPHVLRLPRHHRRGHHLLVPQPDARPALPAVRARAACS